LEKAGEQLLAAAAVLVLVLQRPEHKGRLHCAALAPEAKLPFCPSALLLPAASSSSSSSSRLLLLLDAKAQGAALPGAAQL
jgi:hypothetical protein